MLAKALFAVAFVLAAVCTAAVAYLLHSITRAVRYIGRTL